MKTLVIRPEDELLNGPWAGSVWDRVVDLGRAGQDAYVKAESHFACSMTSLGDLGDPCKDIQRLRDLLAFGLGKLKDQFGLDWWELTAIFIHSQLEKIILLHKLAQTIESNEEVYVSGSGFEAGVLSLILGARTKVLVQHRRTAGYYFRTAHKFPFRQLLEIFWDKTDPGYQFRAHFSRQPQYQTNPIILLPSAYVNVSRTAIAYAKTLPSARFLLVTTRRSGWIEETLPNVSFAWLRSYANVRSRARKPELEDLVLRWKKLCSELGHFAEFRTMFKLGSFDNFPNRFARGLEIRDAWRNVLDSEPVTGVLCGDDTNPYTHIPLLLAKQKGLPTVSCHHGALDGRYMFKRCHADVILAKGNMEQDYLVRVCRVPPERVLVGSPPIATKQTRWSKHEKRRFVVLFSEPYETMGERVRDVFGDLLPRLYNVALAEGRQVVIKLHPFESIVERRDAVHRVLGPERSRNVFLINEPLRSELLDETWFGITILSTVAIECALRGIPCFLCKWLEASPYGYIDQFIRFGVGVRLDHPDEIQAIPDMIGAGQSYWEERGSGWWQPIEERRLLSLLGMSQQNTSCHSTT